MPELHQNYHLFQLCLGREPQDIISHSTFGADFGDGYEASALFGAAAGTRHWTVEFPVLGNSTNETIIFQGKTYDSPHLYLRDLFSYQQVKGEPFVVQSPHNNQYYLAKIDETSLSMTRKLAGLYTTGIKIKQVRLPGVTVFDPSKLNLWGWFTDVDNNFTLSGWDDPVFNKLLIPSIPIPDDILITEDAQNGHSVLTFNESGGGQWLEYTEMGATFKQIFLVLRINEEEFSNFAGIISPASIAYSAMLVGHDGETKFFDLNLSDSQKYTYEKNSVEFAESNQQAPMEEFALVYLRGQNGFPFNALQVGKDRNYTDRYGKFDVGEMAFATEDLGFQDTVELTEHLMTYWALP